MNRTADTGCKLVSMIAYENGQILDVTGPLEVFALVNELTTAAGKATGPAYSVEIVGEAKGPITMSSGIRIIADRSWHTGFEDTDTLLISGGVGACIATGNKELQRILRDVSSLVRRVASICTGSFLLAEAGLLDGKKATTHWCSCEQFARDYPAVNVTPDRIYVQDGHIYTAAGVTAGIDLALALVDEDCGRKTALDEAKALVVFMKRQGGQSQFSSRLNAQFTAQGLLGDLPEWIAENPRNDLSVEKLAEKAAMSERNFSRVFAKETGLSPARFVEAVRIDHATHYLEHGSLSLETIAETSGFGTAERMRRAFRRTLKTLPGTYRKRFGM